MSSTESVAPKCGHWPVDPQEDVEVSKDRIWVDGCFDFSHHGHAGAILQARRLGTSLYVGVHSDEAILENKGPTVMTLKERIAAVDACRWATVPVPHAPYVTDIAWISHYGCFYVVHGDDITSDSSGEDCYRFVKAAGRFRVVKRTPGISTTDLVGRMLLCTKGHFIGSLVNVLNGEEGYGTGNERQAAAMEMMQRVRDYATDESGLKLGPQVWTWAGSFPAKQDHVLEESGTFAALVEGVGPRPGQHVIYVDGGFDLFSSGHIEFLRLVNKAEVEAAEKRGWFGSASREMRLKESGEDYGPVFVVAGIHDDKVINHWKGKNYPIMNIFERGLCVLQCRYIHAVIFSAPFTPTKAYLKNLPYGFPTAVYHGPTAFMPLTYDPYAALRGMGIFKQVGSHEFQGVNAEEIVGRIMANREKYEERQRLKAAKAVGEDEHKRLETGS